MDEEAPYETYYSILEIEEAATLDEIKRAFRQLANEYHPDKIPEEMRSRRIGKDAELRFKEIQNAYEVLSSAETRQRYDELLRSARRTEAQSANRSSPSPPPPPPPPRPTPTTPPGAPPPSPPRLTVPRGELTFEFRDVAAGAKARGMFTVHNSGAGFLSGQLIASVAWIKVQPALDPAAARQFIEFEVDASGMSPGRTASGAIEIRSSGGDVTIAISVSVAEASRLLKQFRLWFVSLCGMLGMLSGRVVSSLSGISSVAVNPALLKQFRLRFVPLCGALGMLFGGLISLLSDFPVEPTLLASAYGYFIAGVIFGMVEGWRGCKDEGAWPAAFFALLMGCIGFLCGLGPAGILVMIFRVSSELAFGFSWCVIFMSVGWFISRFQLKVYLRSRVVFGIACCVAAIVLSGVLLGANHLIVKTLVAFYELKNMKRVL